MPVLQGRTPEDYERCADQLGMEQDSMQVVGVGSMCRRPVAGPDGLVAVIEHLDRVLPPGIRLHGFGVKGAMLSYVGHLWHRLASIDSQAYGIAARHDALHRGVHKSDRLVATHMDRWLRQQTDRLHSAQRRVNIEAANSAPPADAETAWEAAVRCAHEQIHDLIAQGELEHDALTAPWIEQWAAAILHDRQADMVP